MKSLFAFILSISSAAAAAQAPQSFTITPREDGWGITHKVGAAETIFSLARRYHIPPAILAEANKLTYNDGLKMGADIFLPLGAYNLKAALPASLRGAVLLLYRMRTQDDLYKISRQAGVPQKTLQQWNALKDGTMPAGKNLIVGSVLYDAEAVAVPAAIKPATITAQSPMPAGIAPKYVLNDTPVAARLPDTAMPMKPANPLEALFDEQTVNHKNMVQEKVSAGFYQIAGNTPGAARYAFHNAAARGSVIRVKNIANGRIVFVKILGPVPNSKQCAGCSIGLSNVMKAALGVRESKAFVELSYAGY